MNKKTKIYVFMLAYIIANLLPIYFRIDNISNYIIYFGNAITTVYLMSEKDKKYKKIGIILAILIETIHNFLFLDINRRVWYIEYDFIIAIINNISSIIVYLCLRKEDIFKIQSLDKIIKLVFFNLLPIITITGIIEKIIIDFIVDFEYTCRFYNFLLSSFLGYIVVFLVMYIANKEKGDYFKPNLKLGIFIASIFIFNSQEVYFKNIINMTQSHLEYISIGILVLGCVILKPSEFIIILLEDFTISYIMITIFVNNVTSSLKLYLLSDIQLFYTVIVLVAVFIIVLKLENQELLKKIRIKNRQLKEDVEFKSSRLEKINNLTNLMGNLAFISKLNGEITYVNDAFLNVFSDKINIYENEYLKPMLEKMYNEKEDRIFDMIHIEDKIFKLELIISTATSGSFIAGVGSEVTELNRAKELAEKANNAKSLLLARVSHELKTPMNAIVGINYLLREEAINSRQIEYTNKIGKASDILLKTINDILDAAKIKKEEIHIQKAEVKIDEIADVLKSLKEDEVKAKGLEYIIDIDRDIPKIMLGDAFRVEQILINLIGNAIKFTNEGFIKLSAKLESIKGKEINVLFEVSDTGIGIEKEKENIIFKEFVQGNEGMKRKYGGTGLGLYICKELSNALGGKIYLESEIYMGSKFFVLIPFEETMIELDKNKKTFKNDNSLKKVEEKKVEIKYSEVEIKLDKLLYYIDYDLSEAFEILEELSELLKFSDCEKNFEKVKKYMDEFSFNKAKIAIQELKKNW